MTDSGRVQARSLPVLSYPNALAYGDFTVRQHDDGRLEAVGDVPDRCAFSLQLLEQADPAILTWDGHRITVTLSNGSWSWDAEATDEWGSTIYGGPIHE